MDSISVYSKPFLLKLQENIQRVDKRIDDYIDDSSDTNIHNIRTSIGDWMLHLERYQRRHVKEI
jgi:hypothetical protein